MDEKKLEYFKDKLIALKERIQGDLKHLQGNALHNTKESSGDLSSYSLHMADQGTDNYDREFTLDLVSNEQNILYEIDEALERIADESYHQCIECESPISENRLEAIPYTKLCISCASKYDRRRRM
ncbi:TraR/DksA C4-type zinc finger protein [bacterium]|nr:TraR/DksA C4-type zinc finger protein [bacterium]